MKADSFAILHQKTWRLRSQFSFIRQFTFVDRVVLFWFGFVTCVSLFCGRGQNLSLFPLLRPSPTILFQIFDVFFNGLFMTLIFNNFSNMWKASGNLSVILLLKFNLK